MTIIQWDNDCTEYIPLEELPDDWNGSLWPEDDDIDENY